MGFDAEKDAGRIKEAQENLWEECKKDKEEIIKDVKRKQDRFNTEVNKTHLP